MATPALLPSFPGAVIEEYTLAGYWSDASLADHVARNAMLSPNRLAMLTDGEHVSWAEYWTRARQLAAGLSGIGVDPGDRVGVQLPDSASVHLTYLGLELIGAVVIGIPVRAGAAEVRHIMDVSGATRLIQEDSLVFAETRPFGAFANSRLGPNDVFLINSTSGTTGLPKCVAHTENRWLYWVRLVVDACRFGGDDLMFSMIPTPLGFGLWSAHFTPAVVGAGVMRQSRFDAGAALELIERERPTVAAAVTTQLVMMINHPDFRHRDLSSLRAIFSGGEVIPYNKALEWETVTDSEVLQFYGSNEAGALSYTRLGESPERRLKTCGRIIPEMNVRVFDNGQAGCRGPSVSVGYVGDDDANRRLYTHDGWVLMGDRVEIDSDGYLTVVGRIADFIIRGGKNISAVAVEEDVASHPAVAQCAAVAMPDPVFGEKVACYVVLKPARSLDLDELRAHLNARGVSIETWPERLIVVDSLPMSSGAKVAKAQLRLDVTERLKAEGISAR